MQTQSNPMITYNQSIITMSNECSIKKPILIIGTDFTSKQSIPTQGQLLHQILKKRGVNVTIVSKHRNPFKRIFETLISILKFQANGCLLIQVFGTKSIYIEWLSVLLGKLKGIKIISTLRGGAIPNMYITNTLKRGMFNFIFKNSNSITAPSSFLLNKLSEFNPILNQKGIIIRNCIILNNYYISTNNSISYNILWMRAFHSTYNPIKALEVIRHLLMNGVSPKLYMAGPDMGLLDEVKQFILKHNLEEYVTLYGTINTEEKQMLANKCSIYLNTTDIDNSPVSFLEMMAMGLPIVTTNVGGISNWVMDKENALLSSDNSAQNLAELITQLSTDSYLYKQIVANNVEHVKQFSEELIFKKWLTIID